MNRLVKFCRSAHHPNVSKTLRVGTLSDFRRQENLAVRDESEGRFTLSFRFQPDCPIDRSWIRDISLGTARFLAAGPGSVITHNVTSKSFKRGNTIGLLTATDHLVVHQQNRETVQLEGQFDLHFDQQDAFVFCMSMADGSTSVIGDDEYSEKWFLEAEVVNSFATQLRNRLGETILSTPSWVSTCAVGQFVRPHIEAPHFSTWRQIALTMDIGEVSYMEKSRTIVEGGSPSREEVELLLERAHMIKPLEFSGEKEFRMVFVPMVSADGRLFFPVPFHLNPQLLDVKDLLPFVSQL